MSFPVHSMLLVTTLICSWIQVWAQTFWLDHCVVDLNVYVVRTLTCKRSEKAALENDAVAIMLQRVYYCVAIFFFFAKQFGGI